MRYALVTLTKGGILQAKALKEKIDGVENNNKIDSYTLDKYSDNETLPIKGKLGDFVGTIFNVYDSIIFIMATGIVVRVISKYIVHKSIDPAILVMDENGKCIISLLSGHLGGANDIANFIAEITGAIPVITTASDVKGKIAVDTLAMKLNLEIEDFEKAKNITSLIVNDEIVNIVSDFKFNYDIPQNILLGNIDNTKGTIYITNKKDFPRVSPSVALIPKNIVIGIGCRKGVSKERIIEAIKKTMLKLNINKRSIKHLATIDIKSKEQGILEACNFFNVPLEIIEKEEIEKVEDKFNTSDFVKKSIGVGAVCEPCAYLSSNDGKFIMNKHKFNGITLAIWEENYEK